MLGNPTPYMVYEKALSPEACRRIIDAGAALSLMPAVTNDKNNQARQSDVAWFPVGEDRVGVDSLVKSFIYRANLDANWHYNLIKIESLQFTKYQPGQYYDWHPDILSKNHTREGWAGLNRKLSITIALSGQEDYEGGDFEIEVIRGSPEKAGQRIDTINGLRQQGSILVFPSYLWHRVKPVTSGTRYSLVSWYLGYPFT